MIHCVCYTKACLFKSLIRFKVFRHCEKQLISREKTPNKSRSTQFLVSLKNCISQLWYHTIHFYSINKLVYRKAKMRQFCSIFVQRCNTSGILILFTNSRKWTIIFPSIIQEYVLNHVFPFLRSNFLVPILRRIHNGR